MTDPVDTDALRRDARVLSPGFPGVEKRISAAADEVDRLRAEADDVYRDAYRLGQQHSGAEVHKQRVAALRAVIENAPHADTCPARFPPHFHAPWPCSCWKADAL